MSRLRRIALTDRIFFLTTNLQPRAAPFSPAERTLLLESLAMEKRRKAFYLYAYVVMPSHLHLLLDPGEQALSDLLRNYKLQIEGRTRARKSRHKARPSLAAALP